MKEFKGNPKYPIVFETKVFEDSKYLDIRKWYYDRNADEIKPSKGAKGITLNQKTYSYLKEIIAEYDEEIERFFEEDSDISTQVEDERRKIEALLELKYSSRDFEVMNSTWKAYSFFKFDGIGGRDLLTLNENHQFVNNFNKTIKSIEDQIPHNESINVNLKELKRLFFLLLISYGRSRSVMDEKLDYYFENMEFNWSSILKRYMED